MAQNNEVVNDGDGGNGGNDGMTGAPAVRRLRSLLGGKPHRQAPQGQAPRGRAAAGAGEAGEPQPSAGHQPGARPQDAERCEFCGRPLAEHHGHVVHLEKRNLLCACRPCYLLFTPEGAAGGKYRSVPERYLRIAAPVLSEAQWERLQIPVGMAFFFLNSSLGRTAVFYPSPAGATESLLPLETWAEVVDANPALAALAPDVEALLVYKRPAGFELYVVPIDACYELVGTVRRHWRGFHGGEEAWQAIDAFFARLAARTR